MPDLEAVRQRLMAEVGVAFPAARLVVADAGAVRLDIAVGDCTDETWFDVASLTKALCTTVLAMRLSDAGRLRLDDELRRGVTVAHALSHATGLPAWRRLYRGLPGTESWGTGAPPPTVDPALAATIKSSIIDVIRREPLDSAPGSRSVYSDLGFILLGDAVERAGGAPLDVQFSDLAREHEISAGHRPDPTRCAPTHPTLRGVVHDDNARAMGGASGHAGLFATAGAVSRLTSALVSAWHGRPSSTGAPPIARAETVRRFWSPSGVPGSTWCLGWDRPSEGASQAGSRWPRDGVGHTGFTGCSVWIDPPRARWVVLLSNRVHPLPATTITAKSTAKSPDDPAAPNLNNEIRRLRPALHDLIVAALDG